MPVKLQAVLLRKLILYNRTLAAKPKVEVLIVDEGGKGQELLGELQRAGLGATLVKIGNAPAGLDSAAALYLFQSAPALSELCTKKKILTVSGSVGLAEAGEATVAFGRKADERPEIVINLARAKSEGQEFAADLLSIVRIIR
ncbi:MAG: YfiR/HmsC family protein [Myxococcaceae bacterium]